MKIIDINDKEREVKSITKVEHSRYSALDGEDYEEVDNIPYVKVIIIGKFGREWVEWYLFDKFIEKNPKVDI